MSTLTIFQVKRDDPRYNDAYIAYMLVNLATMDSSSRGQSIGSVAADVNLDQCTNIYGECTPSDPTSLYFSVIPCGNQWLLVDHGSKYGTRVHVPGDMQRFLSGSYLVLKNNSIISVNDVYMRVQIISKSSIAVANGDNDWMDNEFLGRIISLPLPGMKRPPQPPLGDPDDVSDQDEAENSGAEDFSRTSKRSRKMETYEEASFVKLAQPPSSATSSEVSKVREVTDEASETSEALGASSEQAQSSCPALSSEECDAAFAELEGICLVGQSPHVARVRDRLHLFWRPFWKIIHDVVHSRQRIPNEPVLERKVSCRVLKFRTSLIKTAIGMDRQVVARRVLECIGR
jgi:hypothetical protein